MMKPQPHKLDLRSLAALRILLSVYIIYDLYSRIIWNAPFSLCWYTSLPEEYSILRPSDTPHKSPVHAVWFYRGTRTFQYTVFGMTAILAILFGLGCHGSNSSSSSWIKWALWFHVTAMQNRCTYVHDGSDSYLRDLLLWCALLPVEKAWSLKSSRRKKRRKNGRNHEVKATTGGAMTTSKARRENDVKKRDAIRKTDDKNVDDYAANRTIISGPACLGLTLQIVFMYLGTVFNRTIDIFGWNPTNLAQSEWLPPRLSAVHYALNGSFATRKNWLVDMIRTNPTLSRGMTLSAMIVEFICPMLCVLAPCCCDNDIGGNGRCRRHYPALALATLHLGLYATMNLPNWQFMGMIASVTWIPPDVWDALHMFVAKKVFPGKIHPPVKFSNEQRKKRDDDYNDNTMIDSNNPISEGHTGTGAGASARLVEQTEMGDKRHRRARTIATYFFLLYMIYNWLGNRGWVAKHDNGDVGELLRFSQYWTMFGTVGHTATNTILTAQLEETVDDVDSISATGDMVQRRSRRLDMFRALRTGDFGVSSQLDTPEYDRLRNEIIEDMTARYPSPRWERAINQWANRMDVTRGRRLCEVLCRMVNDQRHRLGLMGWKLTNVELVWQELTVLPVGNKDRFRRTGKDRVIEVKCK